jgi:hypothetical protein
MASNTIWIVPLGRWDCSVSSNVSGYASGEGHGVERFGRVWRALRGFSGNVLPVPVPGQQFVDALGRVIWQAGQHIGKPSLRIDIVELGMKG